METETKIITLHCSECGAELLDLTREGYQPVPIEDQGKLLCNNCHQAEDAECYDEDDED